MKTANAVCSICGEVRENPEGWFILVENRWTDRLKILSWNETLARIEGARSACSAPHVQQMVVHWMTMGSLDSPFADTADTHRFKAVFRLKVINQAETDVTSSRVLGELAVHRESLLSILRDNPESLAAILEALTSALTNDHPPVPKNEKIEEESEVCVG
jgi:hypothetical protein